jgi:transposase
MKNSFTGLYALTKQVLREDPVSGHLSVFFNRRRDYVKVLYFDRSGFCLWSKRLERGRFQTPSGEGKHEVSYTELKMILEGIEIRNIRRSKRFSLGEREVISCTSSDAVIEHQA